MAIFPSNTRVLRFPLDRSLGWLFILNARETGNRRNTGGTAWEREQRFAAHGIVELPSDLPLELWYTGGRRADLTPLRSFQPDDLLKLTLAFCDVNDAALVDLSHLTALRYLDLTDTNIMGEGLAYLHALTVLEGLRLAYSKVSDIGLVHLYGLTSLQELDLSGTAITDAGLMHLHQLIDLQFLWLAGTSVTAEGLVALQMALPNCMIEGFS